MAVLSRSFVPEAPAVCQLTPVAGPFQVACVSWKEVFNRYTRMVRVLLERSFEVHRERLAAVMVALAGIEERSNFKRLRAVLLLAVLSSPMPISTEVP